MIHEELQSLIFRFVHMIYPDLSLPKEIRVTDDISEVFELSSLEWLILIAQIEEKFHITLNSDILRERNYGRFLQYIEKKTRNQ